MAGNGRRNAAGGPPPDAASLREAALRHLARYAATRAGLTRVLDRRVARWAAANPEPAAPPVVAGLKRTVRTLVATLTAAGLLDDAAYAERRGRALRRSGHSRLAIAAHLARRGIDPAIGRAAVADDPEAELAAALTLARKRRLGPFRSEAAEAARELGVLARAGFGEAVARRALAMPRQEAEDRLAELARA